MALYKVTHYQGYLDDNAPGIEKILSEELIEAIDINDAQTKVLKGVKPNSRYIRTIIYEYNHYTIDYGNYSYFIDIDQIA